MNRLVKHFPLIVLLMLFASATYVGLGIKADLDVAKAELDVAKAELESAKYQIQNPGYQSAPEFYGNFPGYAIAKVVPSDDYIEIDPNLSISSLVDGGYVVVMRHTLRDSLSGEVLWRADRQGKCITGSSLSEEGKKQAEAIFAKVKKLSIPVQEVIASPTCRTRQHAEIGFGGYSSLNKDIWYQPMMKVGEKTFADVGLLKMMSAPIGGSGNRFIIGHNNTIERLGLVSVPETMLDQGDSAVFRPLGDNKFKYVGIIRINAWVE